MTRSEYELLQGKLRRKLNEAKPREMTGKRGEGYEAGIRAAMSILKQEYTYKLNDKKGD